VGVSLPVALLLKWRAKKSQRELGRIILANVPEDGSESIGPDYTTSGPPNSLTSDEQTPLVFDYNKRPLSRRAFGVSSSVTGDSPPSSLLRRDTYDDDDSDDYR